MSAVLLLGVFRNSIMQSFIAHVGSASLSERLGVNIWIDKVYISSFFDILLEDVNIFDHRQNTIITAKSVQLKYNIFHPHNSEIPIQALIIDSAFVSLVQYAGDSVMNISMLFGGNESEKEIISITDTVIIENKVFKLGLESLKITNSRFVLHFEKKIPILVKGMDYEYLDVKDVNIEMSDMHMVDDSIMAQVHLLQGKDRCGIDIKQLEAFAMVSPKGLQLTDLNLVTSQSHLKANLSFDYQSWSDYLDFVNNVKMSFDVQNSKINMEDIAFFAPDMQGMNNVIRIRGKLSGPVRNMKAKDLRLSYGEATAFAGDIQMSGLPNIYETFINVKMDDFSTRLSDVVRFKLPTGESFEKLPDALEKFGKIRIKGSFVGFYNDFVSKSILISEIGKLNTNVQFTNNSIEDIVYYKGSFQAENFNIGRFLEMESDLGDINFDMKIDGKGLDIATLETKVKGEIKNLNFRGNVLDTIYIDAFLREKHFNGSLNIQDKLIATHFIGHMNFDSLNPYFDFKAQFDHIRFGHLGLLDIDSTASLSTNVQMNFTGNNIDSFIGKIRIDNTAFEYADDIFKMDSLQIISKKEQSVSSLRTITVSSDFLNGSIEGVYQLHQIPKATQSFIHYYINQYKGSENQDDQMLDQKIKLDFSLTNTATLEKLFVPELDIKDTLYLNAIIDGAKQYIDLDIKAKEVSWDGLSFLSPKLSLQTDNNHANLNLHLNKCIVKESTETDSLAIALDRLQLDLDFYKDSLQWGLSWNNKKEIPKNSADINGWVEFGKTQGFTLGLNASEMFINDSLWTIYDDGKLVLDSMNYTFDSIYFFTEKESILFDGSISTNQDSSLFLVFDSFNISNLDLLTYPQGLNFDGFLNGEFQMIDLYHHMNFLADLKISNFYLNNEHLGDADIIATRNIDNSIYLNVDLEKQGNKKKYKPLYLEGYYYPRETDKQLDLDLSLNNIKLNFLNPFLKDFVSELDGRASGDINILGRLNNLDVSGEIDLVRTQFRIKYLNTLYSLSGKLFLDNTSLGFKQVAIFDTVGNKAVLFGGLSHTRIKDFGVDLKIEADHFVGLNTRKGMNELYYGKAVITGGISIKGPFDNVFLNIDATSEKGTDVNIPINTTQSISENSFIVFINDQDTVTKEENIFKPQLSSFSLNMDLSVTPDARVGITLPEQLGSIESQGFGDLNMNLSRTGNFKMTGDYKVSRGVFFFKIRNLLNRKFNLQEGGTISWTGDPYAGVLNMTADHQVKTSLSSLGLNQDSSYRSRIPVDCIIGLTGPVMNPNVKFSFKFPNATEEVKQYVYSKIDTTNATEMSQQMLSLLVLNSFSFTGANASGNMVSSVGGSSLQIVANQLGNWLSQISKDVDVGINYHPGSDMTNEEVEVALSTQLFDDRVKVDGNFGYQDVQDQSNSNTSSIVGDLNVEVKLTKDGRFRMKAFNRTNTVDLMDNTSPYTQGVGVFYRKEFNHFWDIFQSKNRKEKMDAQEIEEIKTKDLKKEIKTDDVSKRSE